VFVLFCFGCLCVGLQVFAGCGLVWIMGLRGFLTVPFMCFFQMRHRGECCGGCSDGTGRPSLGALRSMVVHCMASPRFIPVQQSHLSRCSLVRDWNNSQWGLLTRSLSLSHELTCPKSVLQVILDGIFLCSSENWAPWCPSSENNERAFTQLVLLG